MLSTINENVLDGDILIAQSLVNVTSKGFYSSKALILVDLKGLRSKVFIQFLES